MKYFNFPYVVQEEILRNVQTTDLFIMYQCSKRLQINIKYVLNSTFNKFDSVIYRCSLETYCEIEPTYINMDKDPRGKRMLIIRASLDIDELLNLEKKNIFGHDFLFLPSTYSTSWTIVSDDVNIDPIIQKIHKYIVDFFGPSVPYELTTSCSDFIPKLGIFSSSSHDPEGWFLRDIPHRPEYLKKLQEFLEYSPTQEYLHYCFAKWDFQKNSKLFDARELDLFCCENSEKVLENFKGTHLYLNFVRLDSDYIQRFLKSWMKNQGPPNLKYFRIRRPIPFFDKDQILEKFDVKKFDSPRAYHFLRRRFGAWYFKKKPVEMLFEFYIVRPSDGNVASVLIAPKFFDFVDWKMPLHQLLEYKSSPVKIHH